MLLAVNLILIFFSKTFITVKTEILHLHSRHSDMVRNGVYRICEQYLSVVVRCMRSFFFITEYAHLDLDVASNWQTSTKEYYVDGESLTQK